MASGLCSCGRSVGARRHRSAVARAAPWRPVVVRSCAALACSRPPHLRSQPLGLAAPVLRPLRALRSAPARTPPCLQCLRARVLAASPPFLPPSLSRAALRPTASNCAPPCIAPSYRVLIIQKKMLIIGRIAAHGRPPSAEIAYLYRRINRIAYG